METSTQATTVEETARKGFEALRAHDLEALKAIMHPDNVNDIVAVGMRTGRDEVLGFFRESFAAFPDMRMEVERILADDKVAFVQWHATGTFTGAPFLGIEPTGKRVDNRGVDCMEIVDGKVIKNTIYYDGLALGRAVGMLPPKDSFADRAMLQAFNAVTKLKTRFRRR